MAQRNTLTLNVGDRLEWDLTRLFFRASVSTHCVLSRLRRIFKPLEPPCGCWQYYTKEPQTSRDWKWLRLSGEDDLLRQIYAIFTLFHGCLPITLFSFKRSGSQQFLSQLSPSNQGRKHFKAKTCNGKVAKKTRTCHLAVTFSSIAAVIRALKK